MPSTKTVGLILESDLPTIKRLRKEGLLDLDGLSSDDILNLVQIVDLEKLKHLEKEGLNLAKLDMALLVKAVGLARLSFDDILNLVQIGDLEKLKYLEKEVLNGPLFNNLLTDSLKLVAEKLARNGKINVLQWLGSFVDAPKIHPNPERNLFQSTINSCLGKPDKLKKIQITEVAYPFSVAQNFCSIMIKLKSSQILVVQGHELQDVYDYLITQRAAILQEEPKQTRTHVLDVYINPGHGFLGLDGKVTGFYANDDHPYNEELATDNTAEYITAFLAPVFFPVALYALYTGKIPDVFNLADHKLGRITDESNERATSDKGNHLKASFAITEEQANSLQSYLDVVRSDCDAKKAEHCMYNSLSRSCLGFVQDAFKVTGLDGHFVDYFTKEQVNQFNISNFQAAYATKANLYASFNKFFSPVSHILLSDMPDPIIGDNNVIISADEE